MAEDLEVVESLPVSRAAATLLLVVECKVPLPLELDGGNLLTGLADASRVEDRVEDLERVFRVVAVFGGWEAGWSNFFFKSLTLVVESPDTDRVPELPSRVVGGVEDPRWPGRRAVR